MEVINKTISMTRGDTASLSIPLKYKNTGEPILLVDGDVAYFTVRKTSSSMAKAFQKVVTNFSNGLLEINIEHEDTMNLPFGEYVYDCQISFLDGTIDTVIKPNRFIILEEVTYD